MKKFMFVGMFVLSALQAFSQHTLEGVVSHQQTGEGLSGANVRLKSSSLATATTAEGRFLFSDLASGEYTLLISYVGFASQQVQVSLPQAAPLSVALVPEIRMNDEVIVNATRASERTATTFSNLKKADIQAQNLGQDLPFLLNLSPSVVVTSDAGNGVGYTGIRVRGSDPTRINVTVNGIPLNDSESHGVFWVNMPDFASSVNSLQIQRGVGTSTNGAAAFGATVNIQTETLNPEAYATIDNSFGSFNTRKHTVKAGTGLLANRFAFDARLSSLYSDGYVDRAFSDLKSYFVSGGYYGENTIIKANMFSGKEVTYQSWWGLPEALLETDRTDNYYTYENETDNYQQTHYQLIGAHSFGSALTLNLALHYTRGAGYYEQFREDDDLADYNLPDVQLGDTLISSTDLIRRRWLDNHFFGFTYSADYKPSDALQIIVGGGANRYLGDHFGEIIWAQYASTSSIRERYYDNSATKDDWNVYAKGFYSFSPKWVAFLDLQQRVIEYNYSGIDNDQRAIEGDFSYAFFNPKAGLTYQRSASEQYYVSFSIGNREPVRNDFVDAAEGRTPQAENLQNLELGYKKSGSTYSLEATYYLMNYKNQLVLTGELNDVGSSIRTNVPTSYRTGIELAGLWRVHPRVDVGGNITLSRNKIASFTEVLYGYFDDGSVTVEENVYQDTDISFSPNVIAGSNVVFRPWKGAEISWMSKYVGAQYLDNTSNANRALDAYWVNDVRISYLIPVKGLKEVRASLLVNNVLNEMYESNGYTFSYGYEGTLYTENYYYPQAGINFLAGLSLSF
ncbi:TonB-dependent receptor [Cytophagales bacterium LB-30]|uniref:TonB-dependent receptor n=1 Tax=Shiella aurantiaca TaxID=3058365 RepID=A0ABT8F8G0_9BACT|nr:TonB-dependent receptor [Shiella aurantiaca]MDN4166673.1 TonB-dependent receptor [Shiella aurantiaca]